MYLFTYSYTVIPYTFILLLSYFFEIGQIDNGTSYMVHGSSTTPHFVVWVFVFFLRKGREEEKNLVANFKKDIASLPLKGGIIVFLG